MAQIAGNMAMTMFAGVAFSGASLLFKYIDPEDYGKESARHNREMEKYARDHEAWNRANIEQQQKIRHLAQEKHEANVNFNITNKNLEYLRKIQEVHLKKEPKKSDYYKPSQKMQNYRNASSGILGFGAAYGGTKLLDLLL